ncbi:LON peptidase substrate-binding domain-containing protein [Alphaproteobacteria bacterium]|nr:LON peptidase substrate-binding domain-containing protein [Alphaproteobacteria bacterium]
MDNNPYAPKFEDLPDILPIFPLAGVLLLPYGELPLNIFEPHYVKMFDDAMSGNRLIGMIQPKNDNEIYTTGCVGKIIEFNETPDGRYMVKLSGISRFALSEELTVTTPYRQIKPDWNAYQEDLDPVKCLGINREKLTELLGIYFSEQELSCDWTKVHEASDGRLITCLSMICPFDASEKQALLEAPCCKTRAQTFMTMLEMAVRGCKTVCEH